MFVHVRNNRYKCQFVLQQLKSSKHTLINDYQYWQRSKIPSLHFQPSLPRLPIPKLEQTCERYLAAQKPLLIDEAYRKTEANVKQFLSTSGKTLQALLIQQDKKNKHTSYITEPWFDMYLRDRKPLQINYNPMLVFTSEKRAEYNTQLARATNLIISSLRFYRSLKDNVLEPEVYHLNPKKSDTELFRTICASAPAQLSWYVAFLFKAYPLDMSQYPNLFGSTRIPETDKDRIYRKPDTRHIVVQRNGNFYTFNVLDENGYILEPQQILTALKYILDDKKAPNKFPIGVLTSLERDKWATIRHNLVDDGNAASLKLIDTALFNVCLDDEIVGEDPVKLTRQFLYGPGGNRWFDKSFSLIVAKDGVAGVNFEHSWGDGVAVLRYFQDIYKDSTTNPRVSHSTNVAKQNPDVRSVEIKVSDRVKKAIEDAAVGYNKIGSSLDVNYLIFNGIDKKLCKKNRVSPDSIMQLGFQAAYHKLTGKFVPSYESCSTAAFKHGRTETIRPCTTATKAYSLAVNSGEKPSISALKHFMSECSKKHGQLTKEAAMGQGFDRHLYALRLLAEKTNTSCNIFDDPAYVNLNHNIISTSTLSSPAVWAGGFGPVVQDGLGISYVIKDDFMGALVTSYPPQADGKGFIECLNEKFKEILSALRAD